MKSYWKLVGLFMVLLAYGSVVACEDQTPDTPSEDDLEFDYSLVQCMDQPASDSNLEVLSWNIENFPSDMNQTPSYVLGTIAGSDYDLWGLQEVQNPYYFQSLEEESPYEFILDEDIINGINDGYHLGFAYHSERLELVEAEVLNQEGFEFYYFPRSPFLAQFRNRINDEVFIVINLHLKCCGGEENNARRTEASRRLKAYLDAEYPEFPVVVLGDFNGTISQDGASNFDNFIQDEMNYRFTDMDIALGSEEFWSYPSFPSHIDHVLMSDEWFVDFQSASTLLLDDCNSAYESFISDHRPVLAIFEN